MKVVSSILPPEDLQRELKKKFSQVHFEFYKGMENAKQSFYDAEVFITYGEDLGEEMIMGANKLKWIMVMSAGIEKMPLRACEKRNILVTNARGVHKIPMAEHTIGRMLEYVKNMNELRKREAEEKWDRRVPIGELHGKTVLIFGVGAIGGEIARLAKAFGMKTLGVNRSNKQVQFVDEVYSLDDSKKAISEADFIVSVLPSTKETVHYFTLEHFQLMKRSAVFINIGRGNVVKEEILLQALEERLIAHAYLDVFEKEPLEKGHPFWKMDNVTVTPHLSSITKNYLPRSFEIFEHNLHTYINNGDLHINKIDLARGY